MLKSKISPIVGFFAVVGIWLIGHGLWTLSPAIFMIYAGIVLVFISFAKFLDTQ